MEIFVIDWSFRFRDTPELPMYIVYLLGFVTPDAGFLLYHKYVISSEKEVLNMARKHAGGSNQNV